MINKIIQEDIKKFGVPTTLGDCEKRTKRCMKNKRYRYISILHLENINDKSEQKIVIELGYVRKKLQKCKIQLISEEYVNCSKRCLQTIPLMDYMFEHEINEYIKENYDDDIFELETWKEEIEEHKNKYWTFL